MHCGLKLHCLWALSRATVKTLLPRSNAVITRHWGLSHPLQIKPRTGNTQVIRGLLFCISAQCQSLAVGGKKEKPWFSVWWMGEGRKQECQPKRPASILVDCDQCLATKPRKKKKEKKKIHTVVCMCKPTYWHCKPPLIFCRVFWVLALTIQAEVENWTMFLCFRAAVKHLGHTAL